MIKHHYTIITGGDVILCPSIISVALHSKDGVVRVSVAYVFFDAEFCSADDFLPTSAVAGIHNY